MKQRTRILMIAIPALLAILVGIITTLSLPMYTLGPEKLSLYSTSYDSSDFDLDEIKLEYYNKDELTIWFYLSCDTPEDYLYFKFICMNAAGEQLKAQTSGTVMIETAAYPSGAQYNSSGTINLSPGDTVMGVLELKGSLPEGNYKLKAVINLDNVVVDTDSFHVELRQR